MPVYTNEGLRFDNEQEAIDWFKTTLNTETPIGELYEKLHAVKEWEEGDFDLQATGLNDKEVHIQLIAQVMKVRYFEEFNITHMVIMSH